MSSAFAAVAAENDDLGTGRKSSQSVAKEGRAAAAAAAAAEVISRPRGRVHYSGDRFIRDGAHERHNGNASRERRVGAAGFRRISDGGECGRIRRRRRRRRPRRRRFGTAASVDVVVVSDLGFRSNRVAIGRRRVLVVVVRGRQKRVRGGRRSRQKAGDRRRTRADDDGSTSVAIAANGSRGGRAAAAPRQRPPPMIPPRRRNRSDEGDVDEERGGRPRGFRMGDLDVVLLFV